MMVNKYDPRLKKYEELVQTFACGESVFEEIMEDINVSESQTLSRQSWIITGARGIGKSHIITLLYREILKSAELGRYWMPLIFPEELFTVDSLYRLLLEVFENIWRNIANSEKTDKL